MARCGPQTTKHGLGALTLLVRDKSQAGDCGLGCCPWHLSPRLPPARRDWQTLASTINSHGSLPNPPSSPAAPPRPCRPAVQPQQIPLPLIGPGPPPGDASAMIPPTKRRSEGSTARQSQQEATNGEIPYASRPHAPAKAEHSRTHTRTHGDEDTLPPNLDALATARCQPVSSCRFAPAAFIAVSG